MTPVIAMKAKNENKLLKLQATAAVMGFYIVLPSDSSAMYFSEHIISGDTRKLTRQIILDSDWECGLAEVHYLLTCYNVVNDELAIRKAVL